MKNKQRNATKMHKMINAEFSWWANAWKEKKHFLDNPKCRLINPAEWDVGPIIVDNINPEINKGPC